MNILYYPVYSIFYLLSLLPLRVHYLFSDLIYLILYRLFGYRTRVVRSNLQSSFPEKSAKELKDIESQFYHNLCDWLVESIKLLSMSEAAIRKHMKVKGAEHLVECLKDGQSCSIYMGHTFNWEWMSSLPLHIRPYGNLGSLYHALESPIFDRLSIAWRERYGAECIALTDVLRKMTEHRRKNEPMCYGFIADQVPHWNNIHHWCWFLNHDTPVMSGAERIAVKYHQAMFYLDIHKERRGYYVGEFMLITREPERLQPFESLDIFYQLLEKNVRREPPIWLWSHNRWKRTREEFDERFEVVNGKVVPKKKKD